MIYFPIKSLILRHFCLIIFILIEYYHFILIPNYLMKFIFMDLYLFEILLYQLFGVS